MFLLHEDIKTGVSVSESCTRLHIRCAISMLSYVYVNGVDRAPVCSAARCKVILLSSFNGHPMGPMFYTCRPVAVDGTAPNDRRNRNAVIGFQYTSLPPAPARHKPP